MVFSLSGLAKQPSSYSTSSRCRRWAFSITVHISLCHLHHGQLPTACLSQSRFTRLPALTGIMTGPRGAIQHSVQATLPTTGRCLSHGAVCVAIHRDQIYNSKSIFSASPSFHLPYLLQTGTARQTTFPCSYMFHYILEILRREVFTPLQ